MQRLSALWQLARGQNLILVFAGCWVGGAVGASDFQVLPAIVGGLCAAFMGAFGNAVNDLYDRKVDALRKHHRPIPSGRLGPGTAAAWSVAFAACALVLGGCLNGLVLTVVGLTLGWLWLYSRTLKGWHGVGHVVVAMFSGLVFVFGALAQGESFFTVLPHGWSAASLGFLWHLAREWVKTAEDLEDDRTDGIRTAAVELGVRRVCRLAAVTLGILVLLLWVPYAKGWFSLVYLLIAGVGIMPALAAAAYYLWNVPDRDRLGQLSYLLKWTMPLGVAAIWFG